MSYHVRHTRAGFAGTRSHPIVRCDGCQKEISHYRYSKGTGWICISRKGVYRHYCHACIRKSTSRKGG